MRNTRKRLTRTKSPTQRVRQQVGRDAFHHPNRALMPAFVDRGFILVDAPAWDQQDSDEHWLNRGSQPEVGQRVSVELWFRRKMRNGIEGDIPIDWCMMTGRIVDDIGQGHLTVDMSPAYDDAPLEAQRCWRATFALDDRFAFPWLLAAMVEIPAPASRKRRTRSGKGR